MKTQDNRPEWDSAMLAWTNRINELNTSLYYDAFGFDFAEAPEILVKLGEAISHLKEALELRKRLEAAAAEDSGGGSEDGNPTEGTEAGGKSRWPENGDQSDLPPLPAFPERLKCGYAVCGYQSDLHEGEEETRTGNGEVSSQAGGRTPGHVRSMPPNPRETWGRGTTSGPAPDEEDPSAWPSNGSVRPGHADPEGNLDRCGSGLSEARKNTRVS